MGLLNTMNNTFARLFGVNEDSEAARRDDEAFFAEILAQEEAAAETARAINEAAPKYRVDVSEAMDRAIEEGRAEREEREREIAEVKKRAEELGLPVGHGVCFGVDGGGVAIAPGAHYHLF